MVDWTRATEIAARRIVINGNPGAHAIGLRKIELSEYGSDPPAVGFSGRTGCPSIVPQG